MSHQPGENGRDRGTGNRVLRVLTRSAIILMLAAVASAALIVVVVPNLVALFKEFAGR